MIKHIQLFGERRSGTNYLSSLIRRNFKGVPLTSDYGGKHWFIKNHSPHGKPNRTTDNQCLRPLAESADTLFLVLYRNPFDWTQSIHRKPFHGDGHWSLDFSEFIRKRWKSYTTEKINPLWGDSLSGSFFIEDAANILDLRTQKIEHLNALKDVVENVCYLNYESLKSNIDILGEIAEQYAIRLQQPAIVDNPYRTGMSISERKGFVPFEYPEISQIDLDHINSNLDWKLEQDIGYNSSDYKPSTDMSLQDADRMWRNIEARSKIIKPKMNTTQDTRIEFPVNESELELTIHIRGMDSLQLVCTEDQPILQTLFKSMLNNQQGNQGGGGELIFLQIGDETPKAIYFPSSQLISIESNPPLSTEFLQNLGSD